MFWLFQRFLGGLLALGGAFLGGDYKTSFLQIGENITTTCHRAHQRFGKTAHTYSFYKVSGADAIDFREYVDLHATGKNDYYRNHMLT